MQTKWSNLVNKNFNQAAINYNESAAIQKSTAIKLAQICSHHSIKNGLWVDLGSGTGLLAKALEELHPNQYVLRLDNSKQMIELHPEKSTKQLWDLNNGLPKWAAKPNLLASSFALHWLDNPQEQLCKWFHSLSLSCGCLSQCNTKFEANKFGFLDHLGNPLFKSQICLELFFGC